MMTSTSITRMTILALASIPIVLVLGNSMLIPILPDMKTELSLNQFETSLIITSFSIAAAIFIPILGYLSDRFSRKAIIIPALSIYAIGGLVAGMTAIWSDHVFQWMIVGRILQGIGAAGTAPIAMALTGDLFAKEKQSYVLGIIEASNGLGKVISPILGALFSLLIWYGVYFAFPIFCAISLVLTIVFIKEPEHSITPTTFKQYSNDLANVLKREGNWLLVSFFAGAVCLFTVFGLLFFLSEVFESTYNKDGLLKGSLLAIPLLFMAISSYITGKKLGSNKMLMKKLLISGLLLMSASFTLLAFFEHFPVFLAIIIFSSIGTGISLPCLNSLITGSVKKERRGFVTSLYNSVRLLGIAAGPPVYAWLMEWSKTGLFITTAMISLIAAWLCYNFIFHKGCFLKDCCF